MPTIPVLSDLVGPAVWEGWPSLSARGSCSWGSASVWVKAFRAETRQRTTRHSRMRRAGRRAGFLG
eukprot:scaffold3376_cov127-Isochrysis_galbana.AAC.4